MKEIIPLFIVPDIQSEKHFIIINCIAYFIMNASFTYLLEELYESVANVLCIILLNVNMAGEGCGTRKVLHFSQHRL